MRLLRLATIYVPHLPAEWRSRGIRLGSVDLSPIGSWDLDESVRLLVVASVPLSELPHVAGGIVEVPEKPRRYAEAAIRAYANTIATLERTSRRIASPSPYVAFEPETDDENAWLQPKNGIHAGFRGIPKARPVIPLTDPIIEGVSDRLDGVELCAEAQSQPTASGKFRDFVRLLSERSLKEGRSIS